MSGTTQEIAENNLILLCTVGSTVHGLNVPGQDDHDEMGVCIEPPEYVIGLKTFEQYVSRSKPEGVRSEFGDTDRTIYSLRKWCRLALNGNPTILLLLFADSIIEPDEIAFVLRTNKHWFASREAGKRFLGYLISQKQRLLGERGNMRVKRSELVSEYGYDTKYAMQMLRLGYQGIEYLTTGRITLPMPREERLYCYSVRTGEVELDEILAKTGELEQELRHLIDYSPLPKYPDYDAVNSFLVSAYTEWWERNDRTKSFCNDR